MVCAAGIRLGVAGAAADADPRLARKSEKGYTVIKGLPSRTGQAETGRKMEFDLTDLPDLDTLDRDALQSLLAQLEKLYREVDTQEPEDEESEEYEDWLNDLDEIQDWMDEVQDRLEA